MHNIRPALAVIVCVLLSGCVAGAPKLTAAQQAHVPQIKVYPLGTPPERSVTLLGSLAAADCSGPGGTRFHGQEGRAMETLVKKTAAMGGDAVVDATCGSAPFVNNCWVASKCEGQAARWK